MSRKRASILIGILAIVFLIAGCIGSNNGSGQEPQFEVHGKIVDFKPVAAGGNGDVTNMVYLIFDNGDVYLVGTNHFKMNATVTVTLQQSSGGPHEYGGIHYDVVGYYYDGGAQG